MQNQSSRPVSGSEEKPFVEMEASLEKAGRVEDLIRLYESRAREVPSAEEACHLLTQAGELARDRLKNYSRAEQLLRRALVSSPGSREALTGLRALYEQKQDYPALAELTERLAGASTGSEAAGLFLKAADIYEQKLGRRDRAVLCCQMASRAEPKERQAFRRVRQLFIAEGRYVPALDSLDRERAAVGDRDMAEEYAALAERLVDDPAEHPLVSRVLETAQQIDPRNARAEKVAKTLQKFEHSWRDRVRQLRAASMEERDRKAAARLSLSVARLLAWYDPDNSAKLKEALDRCFLLWPAMPDAMSLIEQVAARRGTVQQALEQLEQLALETRDKNAQVDVWLRLGTVKLCMANPDPQGALAAFMSATQADPSRADACGVAAELLVESGIAEQAVDVLEKHLATLSDRHAKVGLHLRLADLSQIQAKDHQKAAEHLEAAFQLDPTNAQAAFRLARLLADNEQLDKAWALMDLAISAPRPVGERVALCENVAMLAEEGGDQRKCFEALAMALCLEPGRPMLLPSVLEAAKAAGAESSLALSLRRAAQLAAPDAATALWRSLAQLLESPLARPAEAEAAWKEVLKRSPGDPAATEALSSLRRAAEAAQPTDPRAILEIEARKLEQSGAEPAALAEVYRSILDLHPDDVDTLKKLGAASATLGKWEDVAVVGERLMALAETLAERQEWRERLAQLYSERLDRKEEAARLYLNLLAEGVATAGVVNGLERLASQRIRQREISQALAPHYAKAGDYQRQVASLLVQLSTAQGADEQKGLLSLLAVTSEKHLLDSRAAFEFRLRGLSADPADSSFRVEAVRLARDLSAQAELCRFLVELGSKVEEAQLASSLMQEAAEVADSGGLVDDAANALQAALKRIPEDPELLSRLIWLFMKSGRFAECDEVLRRRIEVAQAEEKAALYLQLSDISARLDRPREAAQAIAEAIKHGADEADHLPHMCDLLEKGGRPGELSQALSRMVELAEAAGDRVRASQLSLRRAQVIEASLGDKAEAVKRYADVLVQRPSDPDALTALEHLMADAQCREDSARALVPAYEAVKDYRKLVAALQVIADVAQDNLEKIQALKHAAQVHTHHLRQPDQALAALANALRLSPSDLSIRALTRRAAEDADALDVYAELLSDLVEGQSGPVAVVLHRELAELFERKLNDRTAAVGHLRQVLAVETKNTEALRALARLHRADEAWGGLAETLETLAQIETEASTKIALWREAALLHEQRLGDVEKAAGCWRQIAARDALDRDAAAALDRMYTELNRPQELAFALELRRNQEGQSPQGRELAFRLARIRKDQLGDASGALQLYRQILDEDPSHAGTREVLEAWVVASSPESAAAMEILDPVLARSGDHSKRIVLREARMQGATAAERTRLAAEVRGIQERDLGQAEAAFMSALKAFTEGLDHETVRPELERLARETGFYEELAEVYEATAGDLLPGDPETVNLLRRAAEIREQLGQAEDAIRVWTDLLAELPQDRQALDSLGKLYERSKNAKDLSEVYAKKAQLTSEPAERLGLLIKAGAAYEESGQDAQAIETFKSALAIKRSPEILAALDRLYGKTRAHSEQADVLDQLADQAADDGTRKLYLIRRAQLLEKEGNSVEGLKSYAQVLELAPGDPNVVAGLERMLQVDVVRAEAARLLEPHYRTQNDVKRLVDLLDIRLNGADPGVRLTLLNEVATLREALGQKALAFSARLRAFAENPEVKECREQLERIGADTGSFEELAAAYEDQLERGVSEALAEDLWRRLAVLYGDRLSRPDLAARAWTEVHHRDPQNAYVLDALSRLYRRSNAFKELAQVMRKQIDLSENSDEQLQLLFELAHLAEETLADKSLAADCYQEVLERKPDNANAIKFLGRVLLETERYQELAELIEKEIQLAEGRKATEEAYELMIRLGRLRLARLEDPRGAITLFQEVLKRRPAHPGAVGALEEMARSESSLRGEAANVLEPVFAKEGEHLKLVQMLESRASAEPVAQERAALWRKVAELYANSMANPEMAFVAAARALREVPDDERSLELCLFLVDSADAGSEMADLLDEVVEKASDDKARASLYRTLARLKVEQQEFDEAVEAFKKLLEILPSDTEALDSIGRLLAKQNKVPELLEVLRRQLSMAEEPERRANLLYQVGALQADHLKDAMGALATFRRLLEIRPEDPRALEKMDQLCAEQERWPELADVLARRIQLEPEEGALELKFRLGLVREAKLMDRAGAIELYAEVISNNPSHGETLARLEGIAAKDPQNLTAVQVLLTAYRVIRDYAKLVQLLDARVAVSPDGGERKTLLIEQAGLRQNQGELELAYLALYRAYKEDPNDASLRARMEAVAEQAKTYDELAAAYEEELPRIAEASDAAEICLKLGKLLESKLDEPDRAAWFYEKARQLNPDVWMQSLPELDRLYTQLDQPEPLAVVLETLAGLVEADAERANLFFRLGQLSNERLDNSGRAIAAFEQVLQLDPAHLAAARQLEALYEAGEQHDKLFAILALQRDLVTGAERERLLSKMAVVSSDSLSNEDHSIELYRELLSKNPRNEQAFNALEQLLERGGRHEELRDLLVAKLQHTVDPRELLRLNDRIGQVLYGLLHQPEEAVPFFKAALDRDARHKGSLDALREIFEQLDRKDDLVVVLRRLVPVQEAAEGVKAIRIRLAELLSEMGRREEALDAARRALEVEPHTVPDMDRVNQVFMALKAYGDAVRALELKADTQVEEGNKDAAIVTLFEVADLWRGPGEKAEAAGPALERILELDPANRQAYEQATQLYSQVHDWRSYAQVMDRYLPNLVTEAEKISVLRELARVQESKLGQKDVAFLAMCRALQLNPSDAQVRDEVERLAEETGSHEELAAVYDEVAEELPRGPLAEHMYLVLAKVHDEKLDDPASAESALRKILEFDPTNETALDALAGMFKARSRHREYVVALEQQLEAAGSIEKRKEILREIARVFDDELSDPAEAASALLRALELDPDLQTLEILVALYRRQKDYHSVANALLRARDLASTPEHRSEIQTEVAQVYERDIGEDEGAIEGYRLALEFDPTNRFALDALERLYTKLDRPAELLSVYERQLELSQDYRERVKILFKSASIWEDRYRNLAHADACIEGVLALDPQNIQAIKTLERLRRSQGRYEELIGVLERHSQLLNNRVEQAELFVEMGDLFHQQLKQVDKAVTTYHQALELNSKCRPAMHALGTLYERSGNWPFALDMLQREASVCGRSPEAVELYHRMGRINEDMLLDANSAKGCYLEALKLDPGYLPSIRALKGIYEIEKDWTSFEKLLVQEAQETVEPEAKSAAMLEVARYHAETRDDRESAIQWYEEALRLVPDSLNAARPLADVYIAKENWDGAERMLEIVSVQMAQRAIADQDEELAKELCRQLYRLGYVSEKLNNKEKALQTYERAYQLDATYLPALEGLGNLLVQAKRFDEALKVYQTILIHHRDDLTDLEVVEIYWQLGDIHTSLKQYDRAQNHFDKALAIDPGHEPSLRALIGLADQAELSDKAAEFRQRLIQVLDGDAKYEVCLELGKLARVKLADAYMALDAYLAAHKIHPESLEVMDALYMLYRETKQGPKAAEVLEKMLAQPDLRQEPDKAKRVFFALGEIARDELKDLDRAVAAFNEALDADFRFIEAFSAIEALLAQNREWKQLEENYARMIQRLPKTDDTHQARMTLWKAMGDMYLKVLRNNESALMAYQVVAAGMPDDASIQEAYGALAAEQGHDDKAVAAYRQALPGTANPGKLASALAELAARRKDYDSAWLAAQVASGLLGEAGPGEREILTKLTPYARKKEVAQRALTDRLWHNHLFHPKVRGPIGELMAVLFEQAGHLYKEDLGRYQINPKRHLIDVSQAQEYQIHHFRYVARLLGMEQVALFSPFLVATRERLAKRSNEPAPDPMVGIEICHSHPVSLKVGGKFFGETGQKEVYYLLGRTMALLRPELILSHRLPPQRLEAVFQAAISLSVSKFHFTADPKAIEAERRLLDRTFTDQVRSALARITGEYLKTATPNDLRNYVEGAELSAVRTGLFVAGEIDPVKKMVLGESGASFRVQSRAKIRDLMVFALSEDLHALRVAVGTHVEVQVKR